MGEVMGRWIILVATASLLVGCSDREEVEMARSYAARAYERVGELSGRVDDLERRVARLEAMMTD